MSNFKCPKCGGSVWCMTDGTADRIACGASAACGWMGTMDEGGLDKPKALQEQVGGSHYKEMPIQPVEFIHKNGIGFLEGCVIKRMCRWRSEDGIKDLEKAIHEIRLLIEMEGKEP